MGVGYPDDLAESIARGIDMFDCVAPTRNGRNALAFTDATNTVRNARLMRNILSYTKDFDALVVHFAEDPDLAEKGVMNEGEVSASLGLHGTCTIEDFGTDHRYVLDYAIDNAKKRSAATTIAARLDFMSAAPRPYR